MPVAPAPFSAARLRHRLRVEQPIQVKNSNGEIQTVWEAITGGVHGVFWAEIRGMTSRELLAAQQIAGEMTTMITLRYNPDILPSMRGVHVINGVDAKIYNFAPPIPDQFTGQEWMAIPATALLNQG